VLVPLTAHRWFDFDRKIRVAARSAGC
jgi:hypothetical protein